MKAHGVGKGGVEPGQCLIFVERHRTEIGQCRTAATLDDSAASNHHGFPRQHPVDPGEDRLAPGGELHLYELVARPASECRSDKARFDQRARLGGKGETVRRLGVIERLDAERIAGQDQASGARIVQCHGVHAAQLQSEVEPIAAVEMQRQLAIGLGREHDRPRARQFLAQLEVVVDFPIGDQRRTARLEQWLVAGIEIDDREPGLHHADIARAVAAVAVRAAMAQRGAHLAQRCRRRRRAVESHQPGDAAHPGVSRSKKAR